MKEKIQNNNYKQNISSFSEKNSDNSVIKNPVDKKTDSPVSRAIKNISPTETSQGKTDRVDNVNTTLKDNIQNKPKTQPEKHDNPLSVFPGL
jgi:hypothetical protein